MAVDESLVRTALSGVEDPQLHKSIVELGMVRRLSIRRKRVEVVVAKLLEETRHASHWGISFGEPKIDLTKLRDFKNGVVKRNFVAIFYDPGRAAAFRAFYKLPL